MPFAAAFFLAFASPRPCISFFIFVFLHPQSAPDWQEILAYFRGSELQTFLTRILEDSVKAIIKPQYVDNIPKAVQGCVGDVVEKKNERGVKQALLEQLGAAPFPSPSIPPSRPRMPALLPRARQRAASAS